MALEVDGRRLLEAAHSSAGLAGLRLAFYMWNSRYVRYVRVQRRADPALAAFLEPEARQTEEKFQETSVALDASSRPAPGDIHEIKPVVLYVSPLGN